MCWFHCTKWNSKRHWINVHICLDNYFISVLTCSPMIRQACSPVTWSTCSPMTQSKCSPVIWSICVPVTWPTSSPVGRPTCSFSELLKWKNIIWPTSSLVDLADEDVGVVPGIRSLNQNQFLRFAHCYLVYGNLRSANTKLWHKCFPVNFEKFQRIPFIQNTSGRLLLTFLIYISNLFNFVFSCSDMKTFTGKRMIHLFSNNWVYICIKLYCICGVILKFEVAPVSNI